MRKWFLAVSLILIFAGMIVAVYGNSSITKYNMKTLAEARNDQSLNFTDPAIAATAQWKVSANITKGDLIDLWLVPGLDWRAKYPSGEGQIFEVDENFPGFGVIWTYVNVTDPYGRVTRFEVEYGVNSQDTSGRMTVDLIHVNLTDPVINQASLNTTIFQNMKVGGIALEDGMYNFTVGYSETVHLFPERQFPPASLTVRKLNVPYVVYPFAYSLPVGITLSAFGLGLTWFSVKGKPKTGRRLRSNSRK